MKNIPLKLIYNGYKYTQIYRKGNKCIYKQHVFRNIHYYEVILIKTEKERTKFGKHHEERELFPRNSDSGKLVWSFRSLEKAISHFNRLVGSKISEDEQIALMDRYCEKPEVSMN